MEILLYILVAILLAVGILVYFKIADQHNIVDKPNERSSHTEITLRGGGIVYWFAALLYLVLHVKTSYLFFTALTLVSFISFYDDIKSLPGKIRFVVQLMAMSIIFYETGIFAALPWWGIITAYIVSLGIVNAYNFMDGINGMTGLYTIAVFLSFIYVDEFLFTFCDRDLLIFPILASTVFLFFNYRKKARCFAGDIGSISVAFWIIYLLLLLIVQTGSIVWLLFLAVYGVDSVCTILHRIYLRQNIFQPHRMHYYQFLCNEKGVGHRKVSLAYALTQLAISAFVIFSCGKMNTILIFCIAIIPLILVYISKWFITDQKVNLS